MKPKAKKPVEVIVFEDPEKKKTPKTERPDPLHNAKKAGVSSPQPGPSPKMFDQKQAKHEIRRLGIHGMDKKNKEEAMLELLMDLGAKAPRRKCYHIQEYQRMMKEKKKEEAEREELERQAGIKKKKKREKRKRDKDDLLNFVDGQAGYYKDGVQYVTGLKK